MSDTSVVTPELTAEEQKQVLLVQRQILTLQVNIHNAQKQLEQMGPVLNQLLTNIATSHKIDPNAYTFDLDNLKLVAKPAPQVQAAPAQEAVPAGEQIGRAN